MGENKAKKHLFVTCSSTDFLKGASLLQFDDKALWETPFSRQEKRPRCHRNGATPHKHVMNFGSVGRRPHIKP